MLTRRDQKFAITDATLNDASTGAFLIHWTGVAGSTDEAIAIAKRVLSTCHAISGGHAAIPEVTAEAAARTPNVPEDHGHDVWTIGSDVPKCGTVADPEETARLAYLILMGLTHQLPGMRDCSEPGTYAAVEIDTVEITGGRRIAIDWRGFATASKTNWNIKVPRAIQEAALTLETALSRTPGYESHGTTRLIFPEESATLRAARTDAIAQARGPLREAACALLRKLGANDCADALHREMSP